MRSTVQKRQCHEKYGTERDSVMRSTVFSTEREVENVMRSTVFSTERDSVMRSTVQKETVS